MESQERLKNAIEYLKSKDRTLTNELISINLNYLSGNYVTDLTGGSKPINKIFLNKLRNEYSINPEWIISGKGSMLLTNGQQKEKPQTNKKLNNQSNSKAELPTWDRILSEREATLAQLEARRQEAERFALKMEAHYEHAQADKQKLLSQMESMQKTIDTSLTKANQYLGAIVRVMKADDAVTMDSLDRLEGHPEGTNRKQSGKIQTAAKVIQNQKDKPQKKGK